MGSFGHEIRGVFGPYLQWPLIIDRLLSGCRVGFGSAGLGGFSVPLSEFFVRGFLQF